jgi:hypothetical protein
MDADGQGTDSSPRVSVVRAGLVLVAFVVGVAILVAVGTRPSVSGVPSSAATTTTVAPGGTTTTAAGGATTTTAAHTTTTAAHTTTTKAGHHGTAASTTTTAPHSTVSVVVANATSTNGLAAHYSNVIGAGGWNMKPPVDASTSEATSAVYYATGQAAAAAEIATTIGVKPQQVLPLTTATPVSGVTGTDVVVVIGQDLIASG